ncbi:hypothetical protein PC118_g2916 [Phytophthora cactorum]|uniref:Uncharacterized protein n=1 Tax=Phytophthora cactorum TaxID=29920 RepID=A0A8T1GTH2_9STRA|nr:hypothetical protein PC118_g2916 [Phytophthora cactorum]
MLFFSTILPIAAIFIGLSALKFSVVLLNDPKLELSSTVQYSLAQRTPVPFGCPDPNGDGNTAWCSELVEPPYFLEGAAYELEIDATVYSASTTPTVFGVSYDSPAIEPNDSTGYNLRLAELVFEKGYGYTSDANMTALPTQASVEGQFGGYLLYASESTNTMSYNVLANGSSTHAAPTYKHMIDNAIHRFVLSKASVGIDVVQAGTVRWRIAQFMDKINNARRMYTRVPCTNTKLHIQQKCVGGKVIESENIDSDVAAEARRVQESYNSLAASSELVCEHLQTLTSQGDGIQISASQIVGVCSALGNATYADRAIASFSTQLNRGNCAVDVASFCNGWLLEDSVQRLDKFLHTQFNGVALIERQADFCRYKVTAPRHDASNDSTQAQEQIATALSRMFEIVEAAKGRLDIKEYSLSQTTLEQIFNSFAGRRSAVEPGNLGNNSILQ